MKKNKIFIIGIAVLAILFSSCKDELADINTNPGDITEPDIRYLFTTALTEMKPMDYRQWFYDFRYMLQWGQVTAPSGGNGDRMNEQAIA
ncbi:MAG: SusD/RagB family nutrient-binding outer membrane lipoprotein, partial [Bacteroidales bacterium]|nr:SusD/RagB family nutrient-binding outer membrane lipoprotein [Bacteroidales bacterium]